MMVQIKRFCLKKVYLSLLEDFLSILKQIFYFSWLAHQNFQKDSPVTLEITPSRHEKQRFQDHAKYFGLEIFEVSRNQKD